ncbi:MAG TPA: hypothetical protein DD435_10335 [Cyanobacteria bacterium UBA8530]|nr:hypothetical protein [Cyanobacteria bacterium UBA8530]
MMRNMAFASQHSEIALIRRSQSGDRQAFAELIRCHQNEVYGVALRFLGNPEEAKDVAQEAFIRIYRNLGQFRGTSKFSTWTFIIVRNLCYARMRRLEKDGFCSGENEEGREDLETLPEALVIQRDTQRGIQEALGELPEKYRLVISLFHFQALKYEEIAALLELPIGTVKNRLFRGKTMLRESLEKRGIR